MKTCWSCKGVTEDKNIFCTTCKIIQPLAGLSHFEIFDLPWDYTLDLDTLEMAYLKKQMVLHPDKFTAKTKTEQLYALTWGALLNDAYGILKDDVSRAVYMLDLLGEPDVLNTHRTLPKELMTYQFEIREREMDGEDVECLVSEVSTKRDICYKKLAETFCNRQTDLAIKRTVELRFLNKFLSDLSVSGF